MGVVGLKLLLLLLLQTFLLCCIIGEEELLHGLEEPGGEGHWDVSHWHRSIDSRN